MRLLRPLPIVAALLLAVLAGCLGAPGKTMTAREGLGDAEEAAREWAEGEDLHLIGIAAVEPFQRINWTDSDDEGGEESGEIRLHLDGNPGDGKAPGWAYGFLAGERCIGIVLAAGLGVLAEGYETCGGDETLGDWSLDSDEVIDILDDREDWPDLGQDASYFWSLESDDDRVLWTVGGGGMDGESVMAVVDADSGEVIVVESGFGSDFGFLGGDGAGSSGSPGGSGSDEDQDSATTLANGDALTAEVELGGDGGLVLQLSARLMVAGMTLRIEGPNGLVEETPVGGTLNDGYQEHREYYDLVPGHYTVTLTAEGATVFPSVVATAYW